MLSGDLVVGLHGGRMNRRVITSALPALAVLTGVMLPAAAAPALAVESRATILPERGAVTKVVDGDTIDVRLRGGAVQRVRLLGIDTPEVYGVLECGGPQASRSLKRLLPLGTRVRLVSDPTQDAVDQYGRALRYVIRVSDRRDVNRTQVKRGWAPILVWNSNPFMRAANYGKAERGARAHDRGIWGRC